MFPLRITAKPTPQPPLTDAELLQLRQMMEHVHLVATGCPMARRILEDWPG